MQSDNLTVSVLYGNGIPRPEIEDVLKDFPQLRVLKQACDPQKFLNSHAGAPPDLVLVEMNGERTVPDWLEDVTLSMPQTPVMVCSFSREPDFLIRAMQVGIREFLPLPLKREDLEAAVERVALTKRRLQPVESHQQQGHIIAVTGHKGGSGVTTVAVNLAVALAEATSERLALVDLGRPFPDVGNFLDQDSMYSLSDLIHNMASVDQSFVQRIMQPYGTKLFIMHGCADFREQDSLELDFLEKVLGILRSLYRYIIIDLSHWLDDLFLKVVSESDMILMLTGLTIPDLRNLKKLWPLLLDWHQERRKFKVVVNRYDKGNGLQLRDLEQIIQTQPFDTLPSDYLTMMEALNQGSPLSVTAPRTKLWQKIKNLGEKVKQEIAVLSGEGTAEAAAEAPKRKFWVF